MTFPRFALASAGLLALASCGADAPAPEAVETEIPDELADTPLAPPSEAEAGIGTPMEDRVATLGLLNKRNNLSEDIELKPGETRRIGDVIVRLAACERTLPWELPAETGAFVQVLVQERADANSDPEWSTVFSGWLFKNSPSLNVVEHPIYDVWVKDCAMSFPGEESGSPSRSATPAPAPSPAAPAPEASPAPTA